MIARRSGRIITISSEIGLAGAPGYSAYAASKGAVIALTKSLARELRGGGDLRQQRCPRPDRDRHVAERSGIQRRVARRERTDSTVGHSERGGGDRLAPRRQRRWLLRRSGLVPERWDSHLNENTVADDALKPAAFVLEQHGHNQIPEADRTMTVRQTAWFWLGTNANLFFVSVGVIALEIGLGLVEALIAVVLGTALFATVGLAAIRRSAIGSSRR